MRLARLVRRWRRLCRRPKTLTAGPAATGRTPIGRRTAGGRSVTVEQFRPTGHAEQPLGQVGQAGWVGDRLDGGPGLRVRGAELARPLSNDDGPPLLGP